MRATRYLVLVVAVPLLAAAAEQKKAAAKPAAAASPTIIPKEAKQIEPYTWRYTDEQGKNWIYRKTPFGVVRYPEPPPDSQPPDEIPPGMTAVEDGDSVRFERPSPFGKHRWTRKKTEMTDLERRAWERDRPKTEPPKSPSEERVP